MNKYASFPTSIETKKGAMRWGEKTLWYGDFKKMRYESRQGEYKAWKGLNSDGVGGWEKD